MDLCVTISSSLCLQDKLKAILPFVVHCPGGCIGWSICIPYRSANPGDVLGGYPGYLFFFLFFLCSCTLRGQSEVWQWLGIFGNWNGFWTTYTAEGKSCQDLTIQHLKQIFQLVSVQDVLSSWKVITVYILGLVWSLVLQWSLYLLSSKWHCGILGYYFSLCTWRDMLYQKWKGFCQGIPDLHGDIGVPSSLRHQRVSSLQTPGKYLLLCSTCTDRNLYSGLLGWQSNLS